MFAESPFANRAKPLLSSLEPRSEALPLSVEYPASKINQLTNKKACHSVHFRPFDWMTTGCHGKVTVTLEQVHTKCDVDQKCVCVCAMCHPVTSIGGRPITMKELKGEGRRSPIREIRLCTRSEGGTIRGFYSSFNSTLKGMRTQNFWCWKKIHKLFSICSCGSVCLSVCVCVCVSFFFLCSTHTHTRRSGGSCALLLDVSGYLRSLRMCLCREQRVYLTSSILPLPLPPFSLFLIIYSFWGRKKKRREK